MCLGNTPNVFGGYSQSVSRLACLGVERVGAACFTGSSSLFPVVTATCCASPVSVFPQVLEIGFLQRASGLSVAHVACFRQMTKRGLCGNRIEVTGGSPGRGTSNLEIRNSFPESNGLGSRVHEHFFFFLLKRSRGGVPATLNRS